MYPNLADLATIQSSMGMTIPSTYVSAAAVVADNTAGAEHAVLTVTFSNAIHSSFNGQTITLDLAQGRRANWGGTVQPTYIPRN